MANAHIPNTASIPKTATIENHPTDSVTFRNDRDSQNNLSSDMRVAHVICFVKFHCILRAFSVYLIICTTVIFPVSLKALDTNRQIIRVEGLLEVNVLDMQTNVVQLRKRKIDLLHSGNHWTISIEPIETLTKGGLAKTAYESFEKKGQRVPKLVGGQKLTDDMINTPEEHALATVGPT